MEKLELFRRDRLAQLADKLGGKSELGRRLRYKDGAYIGQMIRGDRPITEKTVAAIEQLPGCAGWFSSLGDDEVSNAETNFTTDVVLQTLVEDFQAKPVVTRLREVWAIDAKTGSHIGVRVWDEDADLPLERSGRKATLASADQRCFLVEIGDDSMAPRYNVGEYVLVEPGAHPQLEDDLLVRFSDGQLAIRTLASLRDGVRLTAANRPGARHHSPDEISWMYFVAHSVPRSRISVAHFGADK